MTVWEQRFHPLREEWVIVAAHRQNRPWIGDTIVHAPERPPAYVETCTFCPGNPRVSGKKNDPYTGVFVFDNDAPCVGEEAANPHRSPFEVIFVTGPPEARRESSATAHATTPLSRSCRSPRS